MKCWILIHKFPTESRKLPTEGETNLNFPKAHEIASTFPILTSCEFSFTWVYLKNELTINITDLPGEDEVNPEQLHSRLISSFATDLLQPRVCSTAIESIQQMINGSTC